MTVAQPNPRLYTNVLQAIAYLKENGGSHIRTIIDHVQSAFTISTGKPRLRNVALQVRRAIQHGIEAGMLKQVGGRVRLNMGSKSSRGIHTGCGFICGGKKKGGKGGKGVVPKVGRKKDRGGGGGRKSRRRSKSGSRGGGGGDPCAPKGKSKRGRSKPAKSSGRGGKKRKRKHSSSGGGGSKGRAPKAPKPKKKARRPKKSKECTVQQYSDDHLEDDDNCTCDTCQPSEEQKNSHVSFADEDEICGEQQQCANQPPDHVEKRRRSSRSPRRTSRQIRQGTPKNLERLNTEFIPQEDKDGIAGDDHVPRSCNRSKEDYGISHDQNSDYINKNFDNNDIHGVSQECDNPDCLCNIKQEPFDSSEDHSMKANRDHCPERFSDRKRSDGDPDRKRSDGDPDRKRSDGDPDRKRSDDDPDRKRSGRDPDHSKDRKRDGNPNRDRNRDDGRSSYFTN